MFLIVVLKQCAKKNMKRHEREHEGSKEMSTTESNINPVNKENKKKTVIIRVSYFPMG